MSLRLEMLQVARLSPKLLGESQELIAGFLRSQERDGAFADRSGDADLYYTVFGLECLRALGAELPAGTAGFLERAGAAEAGNGRSARGAPRWVFHDLFDADCRNSVRSGPPAATGAKPPRYDSLPPPPGDEGSLATSAVRRTRTMTTGSMVAGVGKVHCRGFCRFGNTLLYE